MDVSLLRRFEDLIRERSGLSMREQEAALLQETLARRLKELRFPAPGPYLDWLAANSPEAQSEWKHLFVLLTNQESYFFRDQGQLSVIRDYILPELIEHRRQTRALRIWSAGCSTGEEPYSLAMMLSEALPFSEEWRVLLLGTDLSAQALEQAQRGLYSSWSFRGMDAEKKARFFTPRGDKWEVKPQLRQWVTFAAGNLLLDDFPQRQGELRDMDLILCRNVFIYFRRDAITRVLQKFSETLCPHGYLVTGHAELHGVEIDNLQARTFPQTVVYQRRTTARSTTSRSNAAVAPAPTRPSNSSPLPMVGRRITTPQPAIKTTPMPAPKVPSPKAPVSHLPVQPTLKAPNNEELIPEAIALIRAGRHRAALQNLQSLLEREPRHLAALCLAAQAQANGGHLEEAETFCRRAIEVSPFTVLPHHLLARIAEERGDSESAKSLLKKVLYLHPQSVRAYLELSALYEREGDAPRTAQMRHAAREALDALDDDALLPMDEYAVETPVTASEIKRQLQDA